jgi:lysozyme
VTLNGYDISAYQGALDIAAVPADFVTIKATGGDGYVNPNWRNQLAEARNAGKLAGIYHFARDGFTSATAHSEAQWFIRNCADVLDGTVMVVLDWEGDNVGDVAYAKAWLDEVTAATGVKPLLYASYATVEAYDWSSVAGADYGLWESAYVLGYQKIYGYNPPAGRAPIPYWNTIAEWQYTSSGQLPGWPNDLDLDIFYGDATTWAAYAAKNGVTLAATGTQTPIQEDDLPLSPDDLKAIYNAVWFGGAGYPLVNNDRLGRGEWPATIIGANENRIQNEILPPALAGVPAGVLSQKVQLPDGSTPTLASLLAAILAKPTASVTLTQDQVAAVAQQVAADIPTHDPSAVADAVMAAIKAQANK